jgi:hypothetical protein
MCLEAAPESIASTPPPVPIETVVVGPISVLFLSDSESSDDEPQKAEDPPATQEVPVPVSVRTAGTARVKYESKICGLIEETELSLSC